MPRPTLVDRPMQKCLQLPTSTVVNVELQLYSPLDGRVPQGALNNLVNQLLLDWLSKTAKAEACSKTGCTNSTLPPTAYPKGDNHASDAND